MIMPTETLMAKSHQVMDFDYESTYNVEGFVSIPLSIISMISSMIKYIDVQIRLIV